MWTFRTTTITRRWCSSVATTPTTTSAKERLLDRWTTYWRGVWSDYTTVAKDVADDARQRPVKAAFIALTAAVAGYCAAHNPDETSFTDQLLSSSADLGTVSPQLQNRDSVKHLVQLRSERNERRIYRFNLLLCSVMYLDDNSQFCCTYDTGCTYLRSSLLHYVQHIVDIGFLDRWWILDRKMENYDVNY